MGGGWDLRRQVKPLFTPSPDLLIGAGHSTHFPLWNIRRKHGGRTIVLMKPSLPLAMFDLCLIPDSHDLNHQRPNVWTTRGVLNRIQRSHLHDPHKGLFLIGGPSHHFQWEDDRVADQLAQIVVRSPAISWTFATSRRTPESWIEMIQQRLPGTNVVRPTSVSRNWLPQQLQQNRSVWVTEDSVSMTYEAVTSGADVGIIQLSRPKPTRVTLGMDRLIDSGCVTPFETWNQLNHLRAGGFEICESDRAATEILRRFLPHLLKPATAVPVAS